MHTYEGEQCSFCRRFRYRVVGEEKWSSWVKELPKSVICPYFTVAVCSEEKCREEHRRHLAAYS